MGLISTPATESIMLVLPPARAGVGSAVNDATRELGSTLGVAVVGSLFSSTYAAHLADSAFAHSPGLAQAKDSVAVAMGIAQQSGSTALVAATQNSFMDGLQVACLLVAGICLVGAVVGLFALPGRVRARSAADEAPALSGV
jgi:hypothetical protein